MNKTLKVMCFILFALFAGINTIYAQGQSPTGLVVDENGQPMIGVQIKIEGTTVGAITDVNGNFTIKAQKGNILLFSYVGYEQQKITYKGEKVLAIKMLPSTEMLEDVVVIGYGKQKKNSVVSSINAIGPKELSVSSSRNMTNNLAGQVPGLIAVQRSGEPGYDNADFWIRGQSSFKGGTNPLVLVDGVPRQMQDIEADEIESFTLLKDAAATAVYGAEGANGVILITSKRGNSQKPKISFRAEGTILEPTRLPTFMNSVETLNLYNEALNSYFSPIYGYFWRAIAKTNRLSPHSFGIAVDLNPDKGPYWQWSKLRPHPLQKTFPSAIVSLFEDNGFIWGGKWEHFDLMHFEYRPELIIKAKKLRAQANGEKPEDAS